MIGHINHVKKAGPMLSWIPLDTSGRDAGRMMTNFSYGNGTSSLTTVKQDTMPKGRLCTSGGFTCTASLDSSSVLALNNTSLTNFVSGRTSLTIEFLIYWTGAGTTYQTPIHLSAETGISSRGFQILSATSIRLFITGLSFQDFSVDDFRNQWYWMRLRKAPTTWGLDYAPTAAPNNIKTIAMNDASAIDSNIRLSIGSYVGQQSTVTFVTGKMMHIKYFSTANTGPSSFM